jgi:hypothetical protein
LAAYTGASIVELQKRLGHSTASAALIYQHAADERDRLLAERLEEQIAQARDVVVIEHERLGMHANKLADGQ